MLIFGFPCRFMTKHFNTTLLIGGQTNFHIVNMYFISNKQAILQNINFWNRNICYLGLKILNNLPKGKILIRILTTLIALIIFHPGNDSKKYGRPQEIHILKVRIHKFYRKRCHRVCKRERFVRDIRQAGLFNRKDSPFSRVGWSFDRQYVHFLLYGLERNDNDLVTRLYEFRFASLYRHVRSVTYERKLSRVFYRTYCQLDQLRSKDLLSDYHIRV